MFGLGLKSKITVAVSFLVVSLILGTAFSLLCYLESHFKKTVSDQQFALISAIAGEIDERVAHAHQLVRRAAARMPVQALADMDTARGYLEKQTDAMEIFNNGIYLFDVSGVMLAEAPLRTDRPGTDFSHREYLRQTLATGRPYVSKPYNSSQSHGHAAIMFTAPVRNGKGEMVAIMTGSLDLVQGGFLRKLAETRIGQTGYMFLFNSERTMIMHPDRSRILKQDVKPGTNRLLDRAIGGFDGSGENVNSRGLKALSSFKRLKETDWIIGANFPVSEAYAHFYTARKWILAALVPVVLATIGLLSWLMNFLTRPLRLFARHVEELPDKTGADRFLHISSGDEIASLAEAFNRLMRDLDSRREELVRQVRALRSSEEKSRKLYETVEQSPVAVMITDTDGRIEYVNPKFIEITGYAAEEVIGQNPRILKSGDMDESTYRRLWETIAHGSVWHGEFRNLKRDGELFTVKATIAPLRSPSGKITHYIGIQEDVTEWRQLENELIQSQKMEAVGRLAGGVAHDFNNILTAIIGYASIIDMQTEQGSFVQEQVRQILAAAERAAELTRGLLAYSRKQTSNPQQVDLGAAVLRTEKLLKSLIGEDISLNCQAAQGQSFVMADQLQLEQVLINLVVNARDAMPAGGTIAIESSAAEIDGQFVRDHGFGRPGRYGVLTVTDNGCGMDEKTANRVFEPFFTTKEVGKGTGLGLSVAYGIVKKHEGYITCRSRPGEGSTFSVFLPRIAGGDLQAVSHPPPAQLQGGGETILIAEDDESVRAFTRTILEKMGYTVVESRDGADAVDKFQRHMERIDLVILDVVMPKKNGREAFEEIRAIRPDIKAIFCSGYTADIINAKGILQEELNFLEKPLASDRFLTKIREVLEAC